MKKSLRIEIMEKTSEIIHLLEARLPASLRNPENKSLVKKLERNLNKYFKDIMKDFPYTKLEKIYSDNIEESVEEDASKFVLPFLKKFDMRLLSILEDGNKEAYVSGSTQIIQYGRTARGRPIYFEGDVIAEATKWAGKHSSTLITGMNEETQRRVASIIETGIKDKKGVDGIRRDLQRGFLDMSKTRANMIAMTETNDSLSQAFLDRSKDMGITGKEVVTIDACDLCLENASVGAIPTDEEFPSGHLRPAFHPNCQCALAPVMLR